MSTDEEDHTTEFSCWRILKKKGRSEAITEGFRIIDASGRLWEAKYGQGKQSKSRHRYESDKTSHNDFYIKGLPPNAYDPEWLTSLSRLERKKLKLRDGQYDLAIDPAFLK